MSDVLSLQMLDILPAAMHCISAVSCNSKYSCRSEVSGEGGTNPTPTPTEPKKLQLDGIF